MKEWDCEFCGNLSEEDKYEMAASVWLKFFEKERLSGRDAFIVTMLSIKAYRAAQEEVKKDLSNIAGGVDTPQ